MPIKWSARKVAESLDEIEAILKEAEPIFERAREKAKEACKVPNLPEYMSQPIGSLEWRLKDDIGRIYSDIKRIRGYIPQDALVKEQQRLEQYQEIYGEKAQEAMQLWR